MMSTHDMSAGTSVELDRNGWPREIRRSGERDSITAVEALRDETAAYPLGTGPRRVYVVRSNRRRFRLVQRVRDGSWTVEELPPAVGGLRNVA